MLIKARDLKNRTLRAIDGDLGKVKDLYFDDLSWVIRYMVAETSIWLNGRDVLISPYSVGRDADAQYSSIIPVELTKEQVKNSPSIDTDLPVSRQYEREYYGYYNWPAYWDGPYVWGHYVYPTSGSRGWVDSPGALAGDDSHLRSMNEVGNYDIQCSDGPFGRVHDFIIDDETQSIRYLVINTGAFFPGKRVLVSPDWVSGVDWSQSNVMVDLSKDLVKSALEYHDDVPITREYETALFNHYSRSTYWPQAA